MSIGSGFRYEGSALTIDGSATIGGFTIGSAIYSGRSALGTGTGIYMGTDGIALGATASPAEFSVLADGTLTATSANISGVLSASEGNIGGFTIGTNTISTTGLILGQSGQPYAINAGSGNFTVDHSGNLVANSANITGDIVATAIQADSGSIGGWVIGTDSLSSGNLTIDTNTNASVYVQDATTAVKVINLTEANFSINPSSPSQELENADFKLAITDEWSGSFVGSITTEIEEQVYNFGRTFSSSYKLGTSLASPDKQFEVTASQGTIASKSITVAAGDIVTTGGYFYMTSTGTAKPIDASIQLFLDGTRIATSFISQPPADTWVYISATSATITTGGTFNYEYHIAASQIENNFQDTTVTYFDETTLYISPGNTTELTPEGLLIFNGYDNFIKISSGETLFNIAEITSNSIIASTIAASGITTPSIVTSDSAVSASNADSILISAGDGIANVNTGGAITIQAGTGAASSSGGQDVTINAGVGKYDGVNYTQGGDIFLGIGDGAGYGSAPGRLLIGYASASGVGTNWITVSGSADGTAV
jgi:hypothetical protein